MYNEKDYSHAINVWSTFKANRTTYYYDLYLKTDVLLLADVFENFIICLEYYGVDSCHYVSSHELNWDAMLKMTVIELKLISDSDMLFYWKRNDRRYFLHC